ncbi:MAG: lysophospholipid acyltransferase family protein [Candidatus Schekmanbacteria bacterium]|nr:lysophospholipid acyltransferase family protein [Candidatus Schekmanbacteria bacterium]
MSLKKHLIRGSVFQLVRIIQWLVKKISLPSGIKIGENLALAAFYLLGKERKKTLQSLQLAWKGQKTPQELNKIARLSYQNLGKSFFELISLPRLGAEGIRRIASAEGVENLEAALARGKGVLCVTAHLDNWELLGAYIALCSKHKLYVIARRVNNEGINRALLDVRSQVGVNTILREKGFAAQRLILSTLARNDILGILMDQDTKVDGVFVDFFGQPAYTPKGPVVLAMVTGAAIVPTFIVRQSDNTHKICYQPIFELQLSGNKEADILHNTALLTNLIEEQIRKAPEQWIWMHQRWKRRPKESVKSKE